MGSGGTNCAAPGCRRVIPTGRLACRDHWYALPESLHHSITTTWRAGTHLRHRRHVVDAIRYWLEEAGE